MQGIGTDIVAVARIADLLERHGDRFLQRCFRPDEIALAGERPTAAAATVAARWAAKEALLKALGGDLDGIPYRDVEVVRREGGGVELRLHGAARRAWQAAGAGALHLSLSHERDYALAFVVLE